MASVSARTVERAASRAICRVTEQSVTTNTAQSAVTHLMSDTEGAEIRNYKEDRESTSIPTLVFMIYLFDLIFISTFILLIHHMKY